MSSSDYGQQWGSGSPTSEGDEWSSGEDAAPESPDAESSWDQDVEQAWDAAVETAQQVWDDVVETVEEYVDPGGTIPASPDGQDPGEGTEAISAPWIDEQRFEPGRLPGYLNYEGSKQSWDSGYVKDAVATAMDVGLSALAIATTGALVPAEVLIAQFLAQLSGPTLAAWRNYSGWRVETRLTAEIVSVHEWYGRYRVNLFTSEVVAVLFEGIGPSQWAHTVGTLHQRLCDQEGNVLHENPPAEMHGFDLDNSVNLPEWSFGDNTVWDL